MDKLKEADWIALRLLYIMLAADTSAGLLPDVQKTIRHYENKLRKKGDNPYSSGQLLPVFAVLHKEMAEDKRTFNNPEVKLTRGLDVAWEHSSKETGDAKLLGPNDWRHYGNDA